MNFHAAAWWVDLAPIARAIDPFTPGWSPVGPAGVGATAALPTIVEIDGSLRSRKVDSQLISIAVFPAAIDLTLSSSRNVREAGSVRPSSMVFFIHVRAWTPGPSLTVSLPLASVNEPPKAPSIWA